MEIFVTIVIPILTSLAALITAIAAFRTIKEMKNQRKSNLLPEPTFSKTYFNTYWGKPKQGLPIYWSPRESSEEPKFNIFSYHANKSYLNVQLDCFNVGFGVAKGVKVIWDFKIIEFVNLLKELDNTNIFSFTFEENDYIRIFSEKLDYISILKNDESNPVEFKFILPAGISDRSNLVTVPTDYTKLYSIFIYLFNHEQTNVSSIDPDNIPSLKAIISYTDIENTKYEREYMVNFNFIALFSKVEEKTWNKATKVKVDFTKTHNKRVKADAGQRWHF